MVLAARGQAKDTQNQPRTSGGDVFEVHIKGYGEDAKSLTPVIEDTGTGQYIVTYQASQVSNNTQIVQHRKKEKESTNFVVFHGCAIFVWASNRLHAVQAGRGCGRDHNMLLYFLLSIARLQPRFFSCPGGRLRGAG
jgi:hypothetical protein